VNDREHDVPLTALLHGSALALLAGCLVSAAAAVWEFTAGSVGSGLGLVAVAVALLMGAVMAATR
jgi:hypothetical protein